MAGSEVASLSERLAEGLLELIAERQLAPGELLPTVRELAQRFAVTTPTIREALRRLQATDAVRLRHGSGIYVGPGIHRTLLPNPNTAPLDGELVQRLVEARLTIEPGIAALAARHRTEDNLARLELATETARRERPVRDPADAARGMNFHRELAAASGNQVLFEVIDSLLAARSKEQRMVRLLIEDRRRDYAGHLAIWTAVRDRDAAGAERLTREHLTELRDAVAQRQAGR
jgi:GntR family transcriptional regulator, transcriptional repressor for pyruvate dehydrogenase complex